MTRGSPLFLAAALLALAPATASGGTIVTVENGADRSHGKSTRFTDFTFSVRGPTSCLEATPCTATITIKRAGRTVYRRSRRVDNTSDQLLFYLWSCRRAGRHTWTVAYTGGDGTVPTPAGSGAFIVRRCRRST